MNGNKDQPDSLHSVDVTLQAECLVRGINYAEAEENASRIIHDAIWALPGKSETITAVEHYDAHLERSAEKYRWALDVPLNAGERRVVGEIIRALEDQIDALIRRLGRYPAGDGQYLDAAIRLTRYRCGGSLIYSRLRNAAEKARG